MVLFFLLIIVGIVSLINQVWNQNEVLFAEAERIVRAAMPEASVLEQGVYNGKQQWIWLCIMENDNVKQVLVPLEKQEEQPDFVIRDALEGITMQEAEEMVKQQVESIRQIFHTVLGVEDERIVWEVTYQDQSGKLGYYYIDFESGEVVKIFLL